MNTNIAQFPLQASNAKDLGDILLAAKSNLQVAKGRFDSRGDAEASVLLIGSLNYIGVAIEMALAERLTIDGWKPIDTLMHNEPNIFLWNRVDGSAHQLNPGCGPLTLEHLRQGNVFTHWRKLERPAP